MGQIISGRHEARAQQQKICVRKFLFLNREEEDKIEGNNSENVLSIIRKFDSLFNTQRLLIIYFTPCVSYFLTSH